MKAPRVWEALSKAARGGSGQNAHSPKPFQARSLSTIGFQQTALPVWKFLTRNLLFSQIAQVVEGPISCGLINRLFIARSSHGGRNQQGQARRSCCFWSLKLFINTLPPLQGASWDGTALNTRLLLGRAPRTTLFPSFYNVCLSPSLLSCPSPSLHSLSSLVDKDTFPEDLHSVPLSGQLIFLSFSFLRSPIILHPNLLLRRNPFSSPVPAPNSFPIATAGLVKLIVLLLPWGMDPKARLQAQDN